MEDRLAALSELSRIGSPATPALIAATVDPDTSVAAFAIRLLGVLPATPSSVRTLIGLLGSPHPSLRNDAADALGGFGPSMRDMLAPVTRDSAPRFRAAARQALRYLDYAASIPYSNRCYRVTTTGWSPSLQVGVDSVWIQPPTAIRLTTVKEGGSLAKGDLIFRIEAARGAQPYFGGPGHWILVGDSLRVWWSNGFSGFAVTFFTAGSELAGTAATFWDFDRVRQQAEMRLVPLSCN